MTDDPTRVPSGATPGETETVAYTPMPERRPDWASPAWDSPATASLRFCSVFGMVMLSFLYAISI